MCSYIYTVRVFAHIFPQMDRSRIILLFRDFFGKNDVNSILEHMKKNGDKYCNKTIDDIVEIFATKKCDILMNYVILNMNERINKFDPSILIKNILKYDLLIPFILFMNANNISYTKCTKYIYEVMNNCSCYGSSKIAEFLITIPSLDFSLNKCDLVIKSLDYKRMDIFKMLMTRMSFDVNKFCVLKVICTFGLLDFLKYYYEKYEAEFKQKYPEVVYLARAEKSAGLIKACKYGNIRIAEYLLSKGAEIDVLDRKPLRKALKNGHIFIAKMLLARGSNGIGVVTPDIRKKVDEYKPLEKYPMAEYHLRKYMLDNEMCVISQLELKNNEYRKIGCCSCYNRFYYDYLNEWLAQNKPCPICRSANKVFVEVFD